MKNMYIIFDDECNFCKKSTHFISKRDKSMKFKFASIHNDVGKEILSLSGCPENINSVILIINGKYYTKSSAVFRTLRHFDSIWKLLSILLLIPKPIRDYVYDIIAKNKHKLNKNNKDCKSDSKYRKKYIK